MSKEQNSKKCKSDSLEKSRRLMKEAKELIDKFYESIDQPRPTAEEDAVDIRFTKINPKGKPSTSGEHDV